MKQKHRFLAILLTLCTLVSLLAGVSVSAGAPTQMTVAELAAASSDVAAQIQTAIEAAKVDTYGVYYDVAFSETITVGSYEMGPEDYVLMAAQALLAINTGNDGSTVISYQDITLGEDEVAGIFLTSVDKGMILDLATRATKYGTSLGSMATSFNRPEGETIYNGRITIVSLVEIFAEALAYYNTNAALPESVDFAPASFGGVSSDLDDLDWYPDVLAASAEIKAYIEAEEDIPDSVTIMGQTVNMAEYAYLACQAIVNINDGTTAGLLNLVEASMPANPSDSIATGNIYTEEYVDVAQRCAAFIESNNLGPNYCTCSLGQIHFYSAVYAYSRILNYYKNNGALPAYVSMESWAMTSGTYVDGSAAFGYDYSAYAAYMVPTTNCQSNNATLIAVAKTGMNYNGGKSWGSTPSNTYQAIWNLFEYLNDKTDYDGYSNTWYGAYKTWTRRAGNCCDMAHLFNACTRSLGVPARYRHGYCYFTSGLRTGHVWGEAYCYNGSSAKWYTADLVSYYNYLGYKTNTTSYWCSGDKTITLPF